MVYHEKDDTFTMEYIAQIWRLYHIYNVSTLVSDFHILNADKPDGDFVNFSPEKKNMNTPSIITKINFYHIQLDAKNNRLMETSETKTAKNWKKSYLIAMMFIY